MVFTFKNKIAFVFKKMELPREAVGVVAGNPTNQLYESRLEVILPAFWSANIGRKINKLQIFVPEKR